MVGPTTIYWANGLADPYFLADFVSVKALPEGFALIGDPIQGADQEILRLLGHCDSYRHLAITTFNTTSIKTATHDSQNGHINCLARGVSIHSWGAIVAAEKRSSNSRQPNQRPRHDVHPTETRGIRDLRSIKAVLCPRLRKLRQTKLLTSKRQQ